MAAGAHNAGDGVRAGHRLEGLGVEQDQVRRAVAGLLIQVMAGEPLEPERLTPALIVRESSAS